MKKFVKSLSLVALCVITLPGSTHAVGTSQSVRTLTWKNPIIDKYLADPCIYYENGLYYLLATGKADDGRGIQIYKSADLQEWTFVGGAVEPGAPEDWNWKHFWAPEVIKIDNKYYLYYTASPEDSPNNRNNRVGAAVADNIEGPYKDLGVVIPHGSIDGHPFIDRDGQMYMYYTIEQKNAKGLTAGNIYMEKMTSPTTVDGNPVKIFDQYGWQEGPILQVIGGQYVMTFSQGGWATANYKVRYATAESPYGPFTEGDNVVLQSNDEVKGPGHHFLFKDEAGNDWIAYHGWDKDFTARYPRIDPIVIGKEKVFVDGPTFTKQSHEIKVSQ